MRALAPTVAFVWMLNGEVSTHAQCAPLGSGTHECWGCQVSISPPVALVGPDGDPPPATQVVRRVRDGTLFVLAARNQSQVYVYKNGVFDGGIGRSRVGDETAEFGPIKRIHLTADGSLVIIESGQSRMTVVDPDRRRILARFPIEPDVWEIAMLPRRQYIASGPVSTRSAAGFPLHVFGESGDWQTSFGMDEPVLRGDLRIFMLRSLAVTKNGSIWAAPNNEYVFEQWNPNGTLVRRLRAERSWFRRWLTREPPSPEVAPVPFLLDISVDEAGYVWALTLVASDTWAAAVDTL